MVNIHTDRRINIFWNGFLTKKKLPESTRCHRIFAFSTDQRESMRLLRLAYAGKKELIFSSFNSYQDVEAIPKPGDISIVTESGGFPYCVIETQKIEMLPFKQIDFSLIQRDDETKSLLSWQIEHLSQYKKEGELYGYQFSSESPIVVETFKVIYRE